LHFKLIHHGTTRNKRIACHYDQARDNICFYQNCALDYPGCFVFIDSLPRISRIDLAERDRYNFCILQVHVHPEN
jgi:hypothetical protein